MKRGDALVITGERVALGAFVVLAARTAYGLGIGKVVDLSGRTATVAYFDVPGDEPALQTRVPVGEVRVVSLPEQTRVFRLDEDTGRWQVGRIADGDGPMCLVAFPNKVTVNVPREELQVRWRKPIADPIEFLIRHVTETPLFATARSKFVRAVTTQRGACRGIGALLSSAVQLADYQFNVVRKVLQDPVQRYLLADEVGLGKTVEAGLLIRQYTLDVADAQILLIVPPSLVTQWRQELIHRFGLRDWLDDHLWIIPSDDPNGINERIQSVGMVVVDEAHHLSRKTGKSAHPLYELLRKHALSVPRLLLLSGTPVLADTEGFLRILHLLDPVVFPLDDLAGFERRVNSRQLVAEIAASLQPENVLAMENDLDRLRDRFGDDPALMKRVDALRPIVQSLPEEDDEDFLSALGDLRAHLSETYKLHRRVLRNRRKAVPWATPQRKGLQTLGYASHWQSERHRMIEDLRVHLVNANDAPVAAWPLFSSAVHAGSSESLEKALVALGICDTRARVLAQRADELKRCADETGERDQVTHAAIRACLSTPGVQVVVFCDEACTADRLTASLSAALREIGEVLRHDCVANDKDLDGEEEGEAWRRFLSEPDRCRVLVCDARAEEGLNLHGGHKVAFHYDLPPAPNRIEQRLGRLDRFGVGNAVRSLAPVCRDDAAEVAWVECLAEGLQVFNVSIASLQYLVEGTLKTAVEDWCSEGVSGLHRWRDKLAGSNGWVARERRRIDQQDSLDAMGDPQSEEFAHLEDVDSQWRDWRSAFDGFAVNALLFDSRQEIWSGKLPEGERVFRLSYTRDKDRQTLLSLPDFVGQFLGTIDTEERNSTARSPLTYPYAYSRHTVMSKQGQSRGLRSLRYGDPLVESLTAFCRSDDRGRAFAMWRYRPTFESQDASGCDLWFRFDFLVEANVMESDDDVARALKRRAEQHFPPQFYTVWVSASDGATLQPPDILLETYRKSDNVHGRDFNLNPRRWQTLHMRVESVPWLLEWRRHCQNAAVSALAYLDGHDRVQQQRARGLASLRSQHATRVAQIESRLTRLTGLARCVEQRDLDEEEGLFSRLSEAIREPSVRTDVAGAFFISASAPFVQ
jgi:ATP-dependent helicase HepA